MFRLKLDNGHEMRTRKMKRYRIRMGPATASSSSCRRTTSTGVASSTVPLATVADRADELRLGLAGLLAEHCPNLSAASGPSSPIWRSAAAGVPAGGRCARIP